MGGRRKNMKIGLCIPRFGRSGAVSPSSLMERFREVVFRLIMLSAISKRRHSSGARGGGGLNRACYSRESHHTEAVADCIEFMKKSASKEDGRSSADHRRCQSCDNVFIE